MVELYESKLNEKTGKKSIYAKLVPPMELRLDQVKSLLEKLGDSEDPGCNALVLDAGSNPKRPSITIFAARPDDPDAKKAFEVLE